MKCKLNYRPELVQINSMLVSSKKKKKKNNNNNNML